MIFILLILVLFLLLPVICFPSCKRDEGYVDALIVLGCPAYDDGTMSITQKMRVEKAAKAVIQYKIPVCIFTGGKAHNRYSEASIMAEYFTKLTHQKALLEDKSTTTYENMKYTQKLCQEHQFKKIGILTSGYHVNRAYAMSRKFFDDVIMFHAPYRFTIKKMLREYVSRYQYLYIEIRNYLKRKEK
ncbi:YdcF family protein [Traorella massiliensis]|uniref:YdcF family protein n=1 Tax=Traorella massiliensis TaxID=1903263 RepID=UPI00248EE3DA|nr:YdcF family protein [Traorella massiliensis]